MYPGGVRRLNLENVLEDYLNGRWTTKELIVLLVQLSKFKVDSKTFVRLLAVMGDEEALKEIKKIINEK